MSEQSHMSSPMDIDMNLASAYHRRLLKGRKTNENGGDGDVSEEIEVLGTGVTNGKGSHRLVPRGSRLYSDDGSDSDSSQSNDSLFGFVGAPIHRSRGKNRAHSGNLVFTFPSLVMGYAQMIFNLAVVIGLLYAAVFFFQIISHDVESKIDEYSKEALSEIALCSKQYLQNKCVPVEDRIPAMEQTCTLWEKCMNRDPRVVGRAKVSAETIAEVLNGFVEPISYKTMVFLAITIVSFVFVSNIALRTARHQKERKISSNRGWAGQIPAFYR